MVFHHKRKRNEEVYTWVLPLILLGALFSCKKLPDQALILPLYFHAPVDMKQ